MTNLTLSKEEVDEVAEPEWVIPNLIILGHLAAFPAIPNAGMTTIFNYEAREMAEIDFEAKGNVFVSVVKWFFSTSEKDGGGIND